jgi:hypothetical protein
VTEARQQPRRGTQHHAKEHDTDDIELRLGSRALLGDRRPREEEREGDDLARSR